MAKLKLYGECVQQLTSNGAPSHVEDQAALPRGANRFRSGIRFLTKATPLPTAIHVQIALRRFVDSTDACQGRERGDELISALALDRGFITWPLASINSRACLGNNTTDLWVLASAYGSSSYLPQLRARANDVTEPPLGTAIEYTILAKSGISSSTVGPSSIQGNIGVSPVDQDSGLVGFALTQDPSGEFSTSAQVSGDVYAANYTAPTPANLNQAVTDMNTAYNDAAGETPVDYSNFGGGDIGGYTLIPGIYYWDTDVEISSDLTLTGTCDDVYVFQSTGSIIQSADTNVNLVGSISASQVFWQAAQGFDIGATANFQGIILSGGLVTLESFSTVTGRIYSLFNVDLQQATVDEPTTPTCPPTPSAVSTCFGCPSTDDDNNPLTVGPTMNTPATGEFQCTYGNDSGTQSVCVYSSTIGAYDAADSTGSCDEGQAPVVACPMRRRKRVAASRSFRARPTDVHIPTAMRQRAMLGKYKHRRSAGAL